MNDSEDELSMLMFRYLLKSFKNLTTKGLFHIFGSSVIAQIGGLISSVVVIRRLPKSSYGEYVSANNIYQYVSIFIGLGLISAILQFCSESIDEDKKNSIYKYSLYKGTVFNVFLSIAIIVLGWVLFCLKSEQTSMFLICMAGLPFVVYTNTYFQTVLRVKRLNNEYAYTNISYTIVSLISNILFTYLWGTIGLIVSLYLANMLATLAACLFLQKHLFFKEVTSNKVLLVKNDRKKILSYSLLCAITNFSSSLLVLLDITCLNLVLKDSEILADYKVASIIPTACLFVPSCLITFFYPMMVDKLVSGVGPFKKYLMKLLVLFLVVNAVVFILIEVFSPFVISVVYGEKYLNVSYLFRMLGFNYLLSSIRKLFGNAIAVIKKVKINLLFTTISGIFNILLNIVLIQRYASVGAAIATILVTVFIVFLQICYLFGFFNKRLAGET